MSILISPKIVQNTLGKIIGKTLLETPKSFARSR